MFSLKKKNEEGNSLEVVACVAFTGCRVKVFKGWHCSEKCWVGCPHVGAGTPLHSHVWNLTVSSLLIGLCKQSAADRFLWGSLLGEKAGVFVCFSKKKKKEEGKLPQRNIHLRWGKKKREPFSVPLHCNEAKGKLFPFLISFLQPRWNQRLINHV